MDISDKTLIPHATRVLEGEKAVFAADSKDFAVAFIGDQHDSDIVFGRWSDQQNHKMIEQYPGAFDRLKKPGWIYYVDSADFSGDPRLGLRVEFISKTEVSILGREFIPDAYEWLKKSTLIDLVPFDHPDQKLSEKQ